MRATRCRDDCMIDSQYSHQFWRCNWMNIVSWAIEGWGFVSWHSFLTHLMLVSWASIWFLNDTSETKAKLWTWLASRSIARGRDIWGRQGVLGSRMILRGSRWATLPLNIRLYDWMTSLSLNIWLYSFLFSLRNYFVPYETIFFLLSYYFLFFIYNKNENKTEQC